ncbi:MAG: hypothetical protein KDB03_08090 [Planctomycetales bacterium]|nr:hypothetical protein [Planctomycetales bacterium]
MTGVNRELSAAVGPRHSLLKPCWAGIVIALCSLITVVNFFPPANVQYEVVSKIVVSRARLAQLQRLVTEDSELGRKGQSRYIQVKKLRILDRDVQHALINGSQDEEVVLLEVHSLWAGRTQEKTHREWLNIVSRLDPSTINDGELSKTSRFARWELEAAKHYSARHEFLSDSDELVQSQPTRNVFELANSSAPPTANLASFTRVMPSESGFENDTDSVADRLAANIKTAEETLASATLSIDEQLDIASGLLDFTSQPEISAHAGIIPNRVTGYLIVFGLAIGSVASWAQFRVQNGNVFDPVWVAKQLSESGIPIVLALELNEQDVRGWMSAANQTAIKAFRGSLDRLNSGAELLLGVWSLLIVARILLDPMWRNVLFENPLAAFGCLLGGLP